VVAGAAADESTHVRIGPKSSFGNLARSFTSEVEEGPLALHRDEIIAEIRKQLSAPRFQHTAGVAKTAKVLARRFGEDEEKAELAAWVHDYAREWPQTELVQYAEGIEVPSGFGVIPTLLHGPIAAYLLSAKFGLPDEDMANAIRYHTTGRVGMSNLEKILCLADAIEPGRSYAGVDDLRQVAETDLDLALAKSMDAGIIYLLQRQATIFPLTVMARNDLWEHYHNRS
jgi:predicted HD superfamily hydrolase involved in NAD metabolism